MLSKRRGALSKKRGMAKKNVPAALQTEVSTDEEWAKILEKKGLIVVDIYSAWSGPCGGMVGLLKKIKMEIGGDTLSYVTAKCDEISDLERFRGKSEPTWMFIHNGQMVNLMFGAHCPELHKMLTDEIRRVEKDEPHEFCIPVSERSPEEEKRLKILEEERAAKEIARKAQKEADAIAKYETEMEHYVNCLQDETMLILYPWVFKDEEGHKRDKMLSPPYVELIENILLGNYNVCQELRKRLDEETLLKLFIESNWELNEHAKKLLLDGRCLFMRLGVNEKKPEMDVEKYLLTLLFEEPKLPALNERIPEGCFAERHRPAFLPSDKESTEYPVVWTPPNPRSKATVFKIIFRKYIDTSFPYEDKISKAPIIMFKYDNTRRNELKMVLEIYGSEVVHFGIFERDKPPDAKLIATSIEEFDNMIEEKTGYEAFVCVVKKVGCEAFLTFAGIGPYHVSENPDTATEEAKLYFPDDDYMEDSLSDDEIVENAEGNPDGEAAN